jgi:hypothetical protein
MAQLYVVYHVGHKTSRSTQNIVYEIQLIGCDDRYMYKTYVSPENRNYANWSGILQKPNLGYLLKNLRRRNAKKYPDLIDADSRPQIAHIMSHKQMLLDLVVESWLEQDEKNTDFLTI